MIKIIERFANAHEHDMGNAFSGIPGSGVYLVCDLTRREVAHTPALRGSAEAAAHAAAHLCGHAYSIAIGIAHQYRFDAIAVRQAEQVFHRTVLRLLAALSLQRLDEKAFFQRGEKRLWLIRHCRKRARLLFMQPFEKLFCAKRGLPHFLHQFRKLRLGI